MNLKSLKLNDWLFLFLYFAVFIYIFYRAFSLSFTHDEASSFKIVLGNTFLIHTANHHVINSLLMFVFYKIFGGAEIILRLPNVLAFILYSVFSYKIFKKSNNFFLIFIGFSLIVFNSFMIDFFSLARGYGLSLGFTMVSLYFLFKMDSVTTYKQFVRYCSISLGISILSFLSNFYTINLNIALLILFTLELYLLVKNKTIVLDYKKIRGLLILLFINFVALFFSAYHIFKLLLSNELPCGGSEGFINDILLKLLGKTVLVTNNFSLTISLIIIVFFVLVLILQIISKNYTSLSRATILLLLMIFAPILIHYAFNSLYPPPRSALIYIPLFGLFVFFSLSQLMLILKNSLSKVINILLFVLISCPILINFTHTTTPTFVSEWWFDESTKYIIPEIDKLYASEQIKKNKVVVSCNWLFEPSLNYSRITMSKNYIETIPREKEFNKNADFIYCFENEKPQFIDDNYKIVKYYKVYDMRTILIRKMN